MTDPSHDTILIALTRMVWILSIAALLQTMRRAVPGLFLKYWAIGCCLYGVSLLFWAFAHQFAPVDQTLVLLSFLLSYCNAFFISAGCRDFSNLPPFPRMSYALLLGATLLAMIGSLALHTPASLIAMNSFLYAALVIYALRWSFPKYLNDLKLGSVVVGYALLGQALLRISYGLVFGYFAFEGREVSEYLTYAQVCTMVFNAAIVLGMVLSATDRMRGELEKRNLQLEQAAEQLAIAARTDSLTGLLNRRAFDELGLIDGEQRDMSGSIAVIDLNDLKRLNDGHGHATGDVAIKIVARALRTHFRVTDPIYRIGGDEFVVVMVDCRESDLTARLKKLDSVLRSQRLPRVAGLVDLSISWGVSYFHSTERLQEAFRAADMKMFNHKRERKSASFGF